MSSDKKQDVGTKTVEDERIQVGVLRATMRVDEAEERSFSADEDDNEDDEVDNDMSEKSDDSDKSGSSVHFLNFTLKHCVRVI